MIVAPNVDFQLPQTHLKDMRDVRRIRHKSRSSLGRGSFAKISLYCEKWWTIYDTDTLFIPFSLSFTPCKKLPTEGNRDGGGKLHCLWSR